MNRTLLAQVGQMMRRSITQTLRQPALIVPPILFPLCLLAVNTGGLNAATKLPAGAITAVVGIILMRGGFVPGLTALDNSAQIVAWAVVFGYAQQLVTGLIDERAHGVLDDVGGRGAAGERPSTA